MTSIGWPTMNKARAAGDTLLTDDRCVSGFKALCIWPMMSAIDCSKRLSRPSRWEAIIGGRAALSGVGLGLLWYARWQVGSLDWCGASSLRVLASWRAAVWWDYVLGYHRWLASALHDARSARRPSLPGTAALITSGASSRDRRTSTSRLLLHSIAAPILLPQKLKTTHASGSWLLSTAANPSTRRISAASRGTLPPRSKN